MAKLYNFPNGDGTGQIVGIIQLGGGFTTADLNAYLAKLGLTGIKPNVTAVSVGGATNNPSDPSGASVEVILDVEIIMSLVPKADIRVYFAPNTTQGFYNAIAMAVSQCKTVSISWGSEESSYLKTDLDSYNALFKTATSNGVTIFAAAGDNGSSDGGVGINVDFPGSSPFVVSCGGT